MRETLAPDRVAVWYCLTDTLDDAAVADLKQVLSSDERARCDRFVFAHDRKDFAAAHGLLRHALSHYGALPPHAWFFESDTLGKPALAARHFAIAPLTFNLSHTRGLVACAISPAACIGIDAEVVSASNAAPDVAERCFTADERARLDGLPADSYAMGFAELWTLKEAYIKAVGCGLTVPLDAFGFSFPGDDAFTFAGAGGETAWQFVLTAPSEQTRMSVAVPAGVPPRRWRFTYHDATGGAATPVFVRQSASVVDPGLAAGSTM